MERIPQSVALRVPLKVYLSSDHVTVATGKTVAVVISKNGGAFGNPSGGATNATEIANGWYYVDLSTTDTGSTGPLVVRGTSASCDDSEFAYEVAKATNAGFSALPDTAVTTNASLLTSGTGTDQVSVSAGKVLLQATQSGVTIPIVTTVTNQLTAAAIATGIFQDTTSGDFTVAGSIGKSLFTSGNAPGAAAGLALVGSNVGSATSVSGAVGSVTGAVGSVTGNVGGNVTGSVGSVSGVTFPTNFASLVIDGTGRVNAFVVGFLTSVFTEGATGRIAAAFKQFFNIGSPTSTMNEITLVDAATAVTNGVTVTTNNDKTGYAMTQAFPANFASLGITAGGAVSEVVLVDTATNLSNLPAAPTDWLTAASVKADAVTKIQSGLATASGLGNLQTHGDTAWATAVGFASATVAPSWYASPVDVSANVSAIKAKTDNLPAAPASTTNIAGGTITNVTNLTNAPTVGDFTATMKTSLNAATPAATVGPVTLAAGAITDDSFTVPTAAAGRPSKMLSMIRRVFEWTSNKKVRDGADGHKSVYDTDGTTVLEMQVQTTAGEVDSESQGA